MKIIKKERIIWMMAFLLSFGSFAQMIGTDAYMIGNFLEVGINTNGHEGAAYQAWSNNRSNQAIASPVYFGFVANPQMDAWTNYDGDFFTPGSPENGFGFEIAGVNYHNNCNFNASTTPGSISSYNVDGDCITVLWEGSVAGLDVDVKYKMNVTEVFYTTTVMITNTTAATMTDVYYYRNFDPDNNVTIGGGYGTQNTIVDQWDAACARSLVTATQTAPWDSYVGMGGVDPDFRVTYGGFVNRDASNIWNGIGFTSAEGSTAFADQAISLAHRTYTLLPGETDTFSFAIILDEASLDAAFSSLYYFTYEGSGGIIDECDPVIDTAYTCAGDPISISVDGPGADDYTWTWSPPTGLSTTTGPVTEASPPNETEYTVTGTPSAACLSTPISKNIVVSILPGPDVEVIDPGPQCETFDLSTLVVNDLNAIPGVLTSFYSVIPDSADQVVGLLPDLIMEPGDVVYVMMANPTGGCFDYAPVTIVFDTTVYAGPDYAESNCSGAGVLDVDAMLTGADPGGVWSETTVPPGGTLDPAAGTFDISALPPGDYTLEYFLDGGACPDDAAVITLTVEAEVNAGLDNVTSLCNSPGTTIDLNTMLSGADPGGLWTETTISGAFDPATGIFDASGLTASIYTFTYTVPGIAPCLTDVADFTITVEEEVDAGLDNTTDICNSAGTSVDLTTLLSGADPGGTWAETSASGAFDAITGVLYTDGLAAGVYTFTYTVAGTAPCLADVADFTVTVQDEPNAGLDNATTSCDLPGSMVDMNTLLFGADAGGVWAETSASGSFDPVTGILNTDGLTAGLYTFTYTVTGIAPCVTDVADFTVSVSSSLEAGADNTASMCNSAGTSIDLNTLLSGADPFGTWAETTASGAFTPPSGVLVTDGLAAGVYTFTYTVFPAAPCIPDVATFDITVENQPDAGSDNVSTLCNTPGSTLNLSTLLVGADAGGTWAETTASGAFTPATAMFDASSLTAGVYSFTYSVTGTAPCIDDMASFDVTVTNLPNAGADNATQICNTAGSSVDLNTLLSGADPGGSWAETTASGAFDAATGVLNTDGLTAGTYTFTYDIAAAGPCPGDQAVFDVTVQQEVNAGDDDLLLEICNTAGSVVDLTTSLSADASAGGVWAETTASGSFTAGTGVLDSDGLAAGAYSFTYTVTGVAPCPSDVANFTVTVEQEVNAGIDNLDISCNGAGTMVDLTDLMDPTADGGGLWNETTSSGSFDSATGMFDASDMDAGAYIFTYSVLAVAPCVTDAATFTITINEMPEMDDLVDEEVCDGDNMVSQIFTSDIGSTTYEWDVVSGSDMGFGMTGTGNTVGTFTATSGSASDETVTVEVTPTANGCVGDPVLFDITVHPIPVVGFSAVEYAGCEPFRAEFLNSYPGLPGASCEWTFGDGSVSPTCDEVSHEYTNEGLYDIGLTVTTMYGCTNSWTETDMIEVFPEAVADFSYNPTELTIQDTEVEFTNHSTDANAYTWDFGDWSPSSSEVDPTHTYPEKGNVTYTVTLTAHSPGGCDAEVSKILTIDDVLLFFIPNVFTPDGDQYNEEFKPIMYSGYDIYDYHFSVFNRWGELVFESYNAEYGWDGTYGNKGLVDDGVYIWSIEFGETMSDKKHRSKGHVTILK
ncbi:MAG: PKD domain-containing protein [Flavobacteriales bacterium]|nr:PKD domain-containing protein [Flavobacteriales bacterium]